MTDVSLTCKVTGINKNLIYMNTRIYKILMVSLVLFSSANFAWAATITWTGNTSTAWNTASNWSGNNLPGQNDNVIINSGASRYPVMSSNVYVRSLIMNAGTILTNGYQFRTRRDMNLNGGTLNAYASIIKVRNLNVNGGTLNLYGDRYLVSSRITIDNGGVINNYFADMDINCDLRLLAGTLNLNDFNLIIAGQYTYEGGFVNDGGSFTVDQVSMNFTGNIDLPFTNLRINQSAEFLSGIINTSATRMIVFDYNATVINASDAAHINGPVKKEVNSGNGTNTFTFPIGNGLVYAPVRISDYVQRRSQDYFVATYYNSRNSNAGGNFTGGINNVSQAEYWMLDRAATSGTPTTDVNVRLSYNENSRSGQVNDAASLRVVRWDGSQWVNHGRGAGSSNSNTAGNVITNTQVTSFSPFTLGSINGLNPLPVSLLNLAATKLDNEIHVKWSTTMEINNDFFTVQKSVDGINWNNIGRVEGVENSSILTDYAFVDANVINGWQYYRLVQTDLNGESATSQAVAVNASAEIKISLNVSPIPVNNILTINSNTGEAVDIVYNIYNAAGQLVLSGKENAVLVNIDVTALSAGVYLSEVSINGLTTKVKFLK